MQSRTVAVSLGIAVVAWLPALPNTSLLLFIIVLLLAMAGFYRATAFRPVTILLLLCVVGICYGSLYGQQLLSQRLPLSIEDRQVVIEGRVTGLPVKRQHFAGHVQRFILKITSSSIDSVLTPQPIKPDELLIKEVLVRWYDGPEVIPGQQWRLTVKLRRPRGLSNPAGFDYRRWLTQQGVDAQAIVLKPIEKKPTYTLIGHQVFNVDYCRWRLTQYLNVQLSQLQNSGLIRALVLADKRYIRADQWQLFTATGTVHLWVISGLHIGIIAGLGFWIGRCFSLVFNRHTAAISYVFAILLATLYSALAGFSLPTQRALIMVLVLMVGLVSARHTPLSYRYCLALLLCLLIDPLATIGPSFWLSFLAVGAILLYCGSRYKDQRRSSLIDKPWFRAQVAVFIALTPLLLMLFNQAPLTASLINFIAIPLFGLIVVPLLLLALIISALNIDSLAMLLWQSIDNVLSVFVNCLVIVESHSSILLSPHLNGFAWCLLLLASLILLLPTILPGRWLVFALLMPITIDQQKGHSPITLTVTVFDVGQGLAVLLLVNQKALLYDTGTAWSDGSMARTVVIPYMQSMGINKIDTLVISHGDTDHAGGVADLLAEVEVEQLYAGESLPGINRDVISCQQQRWQWQGVSFEFLSANSSGEYEGNNASCVLSVTYQQQKILFAGDIEREVETELVERYGNGLHSTIMIAPHHGSISSSSWPFLKYVSPEVVVFSSGYLNRFNHPNNRVVARYESLGVKTYNTAANGAVIMQFNKDLPPNISSQRDIKRYYWQ